MFSILQPFFERLHRVALSGMNCGGRAGDLTRSGEHYFLHRLARFYPRETSVQLIDAGAHAGEYSLAFLNCFAQHASARTLALEPSPELFPAMQQRFQSDPRASSIKALQTGVGEKRESVALYASKDPAHAGLTTLYARRLDHFQISLQAQHVITLDTLDALASQEALSHIHLLKLDVEGHELSALKGCRELIESGRIDFIQFEFGGCNIDSRTFFQDFYYLLTPHFHLARLLPDGVHWIPRYREADEIFMTTNFIAVRRPLYENFLRD